jgi:hypothetical protein
MEKEKLPLLASIDIGRCNLAICVFSCAERQCLYWKNFDLDLRTYHPKTYRDRLLEVLQRAPLADIYLVERQVHMAPKNCTLEAIVWCLVPYVLKRQIVGISPSAVSRFFGMNRGNKYSKKRDAVHLTSQILVCSRAKITFQDPSLAAAFLQAGRKRKLEKTAEMKSNLATPVLSKKQKLPKKSKTLKRDDLSDAFLQALFYCETEVCPGISDFAPSIYTHYRGKKRKCDVSDGGTTVTTSKTTKTTTSVSAPEPVFKKIKMTGTVKSTSLTHARSAPLLPQEEGGDSDLDSEEEHHLIQSSQQSSFEIPTRTVVDKSGNVTKQSYFSAIPSPTRGFEGAKKSASIKTTGDSSSNNAKTGKKYTIDLDLC